MSAGPSAAPERMPSSPTAGRGHPSPSTTGGPHQVLAAPSFAHATYEIARKEFLQLLRTKRLLGLGIVVLIAMILLTLVLPLTIFNLQDFASDVSGDDGVEEATQDIPYIHNGILLFFLGAAFILSGFFLFQLMAIVLASDAVSSEWQARTVFLVLSKPVPRTAFVLGKFLGIALPLAALVGVLLILDYLMVVLVFPGWPAANEVGRFFGALGMVMLGVMTYTALAVMFSTITRSTVASMLLAVLAWIIVLPLLGQIQFFIELATGDILTVGGMRVYWSNYLNPGGMMSASAEVLVPEIGGFLGAISGGGAAPPWWAACIAMLVHLGIYLGVATVVVQARNFE